MDDYTHLVHVYLLQTKDEAERYINKFVLEGEAHFNVKTSTLRCDNGGEYTTNSLKE